MSSPVTATRTTAGRRKSASGAARTGLLQRKCSCGASKSPLGHSCDECQSKALQRKLTVGVSDDPFEREADRVADQVLAANPRGNSAPPTISRVGMQSADADVGAPPSVERVLSGAGM